MIRPFELGPFASRKEAEQTCKRMRAMRAACNVVQRDGSFYCLVSGLPGSVEFI